MEIKLTLALPRDEMSVPVVRRILKHSMEVLGVAADCTSDIELALTEACTNVLDHAEDSDEYEISAGIDGDQCVIEVIDRGAGFDASLKGLQDADAGSEDGRGIQLMRALVDKVEFTQRSSSGNVVHLEKALAWKDGSVIRKLTEGHAEPEHGPWAHDEQLTEAPEPTG